MFAALVMSVRSSALAESKAETAMPSTLNICVLGATIAPTRADGSQWQSVGKSLPASLRALVEKRLIELAAKVTEFSVVNIADAEGILGPLFAHALVAALEKPHAFGLVELDPKGVIAGAPAYTRTILSLLPIGSTQPRFHNICFDGVAWTPAMRLRMDLKNAHLNGSHDEIGQVDINAETIASVYRHSGTAHVIVAQQNHNLQSILLSVTMGAARSPRTP